MGDHTIQVKTKSLQTTTYSATLIAFSFVLAYILSSFPIMLLTLFITDIAQVFGIEVGMMGVVRSVAEVGSVVMGVLLGGLSVRYRQKSLLLLGIGIICVGTLTLGVFVVFPLFLVLYAFLGVSRVTIRSMSQSLVGQLFSTAERPRITGYLVIGESGGYLIGSALSIVLPNFQAIALLFLCPLSAVVLILILKGIPSTPLVQQNPLSAFREVFRNRSATMVLISHALTAVSVVHCLLTFFMPLYLQRFQADRVVITMVFSITMVTIAGVGMVLGRVISKFGRKPVVVVSALMVSLLSAVMMLAPIFLISILAWVVAMAFTGLYLGSANSYALEQLPEYRGTMMSLHLTAQFIAQAIGSSVGGLILIAYGFNGLGWFSLIGVTGVLLFNFFTRDPTQTQQVTQSSKVGSLINTKKAS
ncbi:MAG: MFS transporter [Candidatus Thorarchaeota archaeon]|jgi:SHS family sialic acid transporter-like MFS transporter